MHQLPKWSFFVDQNLFKILYPQSYVYIPLFLIFLTPMEIFNSLPLPPLYNLYTSIYYCQHQKYKEWHESHGKFRLSYSHPIVCIYTTVYHDYYQSYLNTYIKNEIDATGNRGGGVKRGGCPLVSLVYCSRHLSVCLSVCT